MGLNVTKLFDYFAMACVVGAGWFVYRATGNQDLGKATVLGLAAIILITLNGRKD